MKLTRDDQREHPQLAMIFTLREQLLLMEPVLAAVHQDGETTAPSDQARSILKVARILQSQLEAYQGLLSLGDPKIRPRPKA